MMYKIGIYIFTSSFITNANSFTTVRTCIRRDLANLFLRSLHNLVILLYRNCPDVRHDNR